MVLKVCAWPQTWRSLSLPPRGCLSSAATEATATPASRRPANLSSFRINCKYYFLRINYFFQTQDAFTSWVCLGVEEHWVQAIVLPLPWQTEIWAAQESQGPALLGGLMKIGII